MAQTQLSSTMYRLKLFGPLSLCFEPGSGPAQSIALGGRPGRLLAYLALAKGRYFSRSELVSTLWADRAERADRADTGPAGALNTALWRLRGLIERPPFRQGELIACDRGGALGLHEQARMLVDVAEFARLTEPGLAKSLAQLSEADVIGLREGVGLYRADVLTDFTDEWALREREQHRRKYLNALGRLTHLSTLARDYASAIRYAQAILDHDALREDVHRELMHLFMLSGQRAMALRQFEICRAALRRELAIQPMRETMEIYQSVADHAVGREAGPSQGLRGDAPFHAEAGLHEVRAVSPQPEMALQRRGPASALVPLPPGAPGAALPGASARQLIEAARRCLAEADAQLQMSLPLFDDGPAAGFDAPR